MQVVIVGAGIGGLGLAAGLSGSGYDVRVLEAASQLRTTGAALTLYSNGTAALARLGAPLPESIGGRIDLLRIDDHSGRRLIDFDLARMRQRTGHPVVTVPRRELLRHLAGRLDEQVVRFAAPVATVRLEGRPCVLDPSGTEHAADVVVGADGHGSVVRAATLAGAAARPTSWTTWQGVTEILPALATGSTGRLVVGPAGLVGLMPAGNGLLQWWFDVNDPVAPDAPVQHLRARFDGYPDPVRPLLDAITEADLEAFPHVLHTVPNRWGTGAVTLLGDAAHAFPPSQAQGANQALEDAAVLREVLLQPGDDLVDRLRRYERLRAAKVRRISRMAGSEVTNRASQPWVRLLSARVPASVAGAAHTALLRRTSSVL